MTNMYLRFFVCMLIGNGILVAADSNDVNFKDFEQNSVLTLAHVIFRHGDRSPTKQPPGDNYGISYWEDGWGQLSNLGKMQNLNLGKWLRRRLDKFLSNRYNLNDTYVQSSNVPRTLTSALSILAGLYPPVGDQIWNNLIDWQPIPVHTRPLELEYLIGPEVPTTCAAFQNAYAKHMQSHELIEYNESIRPLYNYLTNHTGVVTSKLIEIWAIRDAWLCESIHGLKLPNWAGAVFPNDKQLYDAALKHFTLQTGTRFLTKLRSGFLLKNILDRCTSKANKSLSPDRKLWMYSTHDSVLLSLLRALKISDDQFVPYAAAIVLELRKYRDRDYIQIFYKNSDEEPAALEVPGCGKACPLSKMYQLYDDIIPKNDFLTECLIDE